MQEICFVFGSNLVGVHGAGAAKKAREQYGAETGVGRGRTGMAYAIPTKRTPTRNTRQFKMNEIQANVNEFLTYAWAHPSISFVVSPVGCGLAGYMDHEIAPMFKDAPSNCTFSPIWSKFGLPVWDVAP